MTTEVTYVFGEFEVKKTGRVAVRTVGSTAPSQELVEITPANDYDGTWKKWVNPKALFSIVDNKKDTP